MGGYKYLMQNWRSGDKISIFGFSRGAYTARALAGMLTKVGLLPRDNVEQVPFAYQMYTRTDKDGLIQAKGFKQTFCRDVSIEFLGVWCVIRKFGADANLTKPGNHRDTVASTGIVMSRTLPFTTNNAAIKTFRHALSLDEHRAKFVPTFYHRKAPSPDADEHDPEHTSPGLVPTPKLAAGAEAKATKATAGEHNDAMSKNLGVPPDSNGANGDGAETHLLQSQKGKSALRSRKVWSIFSKEMKTTVSAKDSEQWEGKQCLDVKEVWFAGCHSGNPESFDTQDTRGSPLNA